MLILLLAFALGSTWVLGSVYRQYLIEEREAVVEGELSEATNRLRTLMQDRISLLDSLEALVLSREEINAIDELFGSFARGLTSAHPGINHLFLAPTQRIQFIYPRDAGAPLIGRQLTATDWSDREAVEHALRTRRIMLGEVQPLTNGNMGLRAYKPLIINGEPWGTVGIEMDLSRSLQIARFGSNQPGSIQFSLRDGSGRTISGPTEVFARHPLIKRLSLPGANWEVAAAPTLTWQELISTDLLMFRGYILVLILLLSMVAWFLFSREHWMSQVIAQRTDELDQANARLRSENRHRQQIEKSLREREELLQITLDQTTAGIAQMRLDGRLFTLNQPFADILGYDHAELLNRDLRSLVADTDAIDRDMLNASTRTSVTAGATARQLLRRDGTAIWVNLSLSLARPGSREPAYYVVVIQDISELKATEQAARQREQRLRMLFDALPDAVLLLDIQANRALDTNRAAERLLEMSREALLAEPADTWLASQPRAGETSEFRPAEVRLPQGRRSLQLRMTFFTAEGRALSLCQLAKDSRPAEEPAAAGPPVLPHSGESNFHLLAEAAPAILLLADTRGRVTYANPAWREITGRETGQALDQGWIQAVALPERETVLNAYLTAIRDAKPFSIDFALAGSPSERHLNLTGSPLPETPGRSARWIMAACDITGLAARMHRIEAHNNELVGFSRSMSHDLHAPLRSIHGFAQSVLEDCVGTSQSPCRDHAERLTRSAARLSRLVTDLLSYSRMQDAELGVETVRFEDVVDDVISQLSMDIASSQAQLQIDRPLERALGHHATLVSVVSNLVSNALKFTPADRAPQIRIGSRTDRQKVRFWVEDEGIGVAAADRQSIFEPFKRLHSESDFPGSGLGLALVARAMCKMGGTAGMEPAPHGGSRFWIELAADQADRAG